MKVDDFVVERLHAWGVRTGMLGFHSSAELRQRPPHGYRVGEGDEPFRQSKASGAACGGV
jgi:hypothetical protein